MGRGLLLSGLVYLIPTLFPSFTKDWEPSPLPGVLAPTAAPAFDSDPEISDMDEDEPGGLVGSVDVVSPSGHSDAQTLAMMLQEQLDAINEEIRFGLGRRVWEAPCRTGAPLGSGTAGQILRVSACLF